MLFFNSPFRMPFGFALTVLLTVFVGVGPVGAAPVEVDTSDAPRGVLMGRVVDQTTHQPLPGAHVRIKRLERGTATGSNGRFTLDGLPSGTYTARGPVPVTNGRPAVRRRHAHRGGQRTYGRR